MADPDDEALNDLRTFGDDHVRRMMASSILKFIRCMSHPQFPLIPANILSRAIQSHWNIHRLPHPTIRS